MKYQLNILFPLLAAACGVHEVAPVEGNQVALVAAVEGDDWVHFDEGGQAKAYFRRVKDSVAVEFIALTGVTPGLVGVEFHPAHMSRTRGIFTTSLERFYDTLPVRTAQELAARGGNELNISVYVVDPTWPTGLRHVKTILVPPRFYR
jgi:hypothetical protein